MVVYDTSLLFSRTVELLVQVGRVRSWGLLGRALVLMLSVAKIMLWCVGSW